MRKKIFVLMAALLMAMIALDNAHAQSYSNAVMALNPVGYWPLTETATPGNGYYVATNLGTAGASANGYYQTWYQPTGTGFFPTNNILHTAGALGDGDQAMQCNGSPAGAGQYVVFPRATNGVANAAVAIQAPLSIEVWVKSGNTNLGVQAIVNEGRNPVAFDPAVGATNVYLGFSLGQFKNFFYWQVYNARLNTNGGYPECDTTPISPNTWYHIVATFDGSGIAIFMNGVQVGGTKAETANYLGSKYVVDPVCPLLIGTGTELSAGNGGINFNGAIDEVAIYTNALSLSQIQAHYAAGPGTSYSATVLADNPLIYLRLDEPALTTYPAAGTYPVATNYGVVGALANGLYQPGTAPGVAGPPYSGFGASSHAVAFNGFYGAVDVGGGSLPHEFNPTGQAAFSVVTWFQGNPADAPARFQVLAGHSDRSWRLAMDGGSATSPAGNRFNPGNGPELSFVNTADVVTNGFRLNDGRWHMAAGVSDGTNDYLYLDGVLAKSGTAVGSIVGTNLDLMLGGDPQYTTPSANSPLLRGFDGQLAHVAIFTNALSAAQVQQIYGAAGVPPSISQQPQSSTNNSGTTVTIAAGARGSAPLGYQWYRNNSPVATQTNASLVFNPITTNNAGTYYLVANNPYGSATSSIIQLTVFGPPVIQQQPLTDVQVFAGTSPTFTVTAAGAPPLAYQWSLNGTAIAGATKSNYTVVNVQTGGTYGCTVTNNVGATPINPVALTVLPDPTAPFPARVLADGPVAYFRLDESSGTTAYDYAGGYNATYTNVNLGQPGYDSTAPVPSDPGETSVLFGGAGNNSYAGNVPSYLNFGTPNGASAAFSVEAWFTEYLFQNGGNAIVALGYGNGGEEFVLDTGNGASGALRFFVRNAAGTVSVANSSYVPVNDGKWHHVVGVCDQAGGHVYLYMDGVQLASGTIVANTGILGATQPLSIGARESGNSTPVNYDFQFIGAIDDVAIYNKALTAAQVQNHYYASGIAPLITQLVPVNETTNQGATATFTVSATGTLPLSYQWLDNNGSPIPWGTNSTLNITNVQQSQSGGYQVNVTNPYGTSSTNANLTVDLGPPQIVVDLQPLNATVYAGTTNIYSVTVSGSAPFFYQWYQDGTAVAGATNSSYTFAALAGTNTYYCAVTNSFSYSQAGGPTYSSTATLVGVSAPTLNPANFTYHAKITFTGYNRGETLADFPVLVKFGTNIPGFNYNQPASATGGDLRFTDAGGTRVIPHEIDEWNPGGDSSVWVQVPRLSGTNDSVWAYWGNPADTTLPATSTNGAVWIPAAFEQLPQYDLVWHLKESGFPFADSTLLYPATNGVAPASTNGIVGHGGFYTGVPYLDAGFVNFSNAFTVNAWLNLSPVSDIQTVWANKVGGFAANGFALYVNSYQTSDQKIHLETGTGSAGQEATSAAGAVSPGQWHMLTAAIDQGAGQARLYVDGVDVTSSSGIRTDFALTNDVVLGRFADGNFGFHGDLDEARIRAGTNSPNWIWASYMTVASNPAFESYSTVVSSAVTITYQISGGNLVLSWSQGTLQSASQVTGPYTDIPSATSPYTVPRTAAQQFYRVKVR